MVRAVNPPKYGRGALLDGKDIRMKYKMKKSIKSFLFGLLVFALIPYSKCYAKTTKWEALDAYKNLLVQRCGINGEKNSFLFSNLGA